MAKIRLIKQFRFEMAHALWGYDGPCRNIHGHSYELEVCISGEPVNLKESPKNGMLMDFGDFKKMIYTHIIDKYDHSLVIQEGTPHETVFNEQEIFKKIIVKPYQPTCENLLVEFAFILKKQLPEKIKLESIKLRETASSWAEWRAEDNI